MAPVPVDDFVFRVPGPLLGWMRPSHHYGGVHDPPEQVAYKKMVAQLGGYQPIPAAAPTH